ncbi:hypothetical protein BDF22DRAFT_694966 [Syncephalis plumigaleata]|nr:hypothetical protein BDF22DRAFT_694966 [Syncephalis plumigaleata]
MPRAKSRRFTRKHQFSEWLATTASPNGELVYQGSYRVSRRRIIPSHPNGPNWISDMASLYVCSRYKEHIVNEEIRRIKRGMPIKRETKEKEESRIFSHLRRSPCKAHFIFQDVDYWWKHTHDDNEDMQQPSYITELRNEKYDGLGGWSLIGIPLEETRELLDRTLREIVMKTIMPPTFTKAEYTRAWQRVLKLSKLLGFTSDSEFALVRDQFCYVRPISEIITSQEYTRARNWLMTSSHLLSLTIDAEVEAARMQVIRSRLPRPLSATAAVYHRVSNCV